VSEAGGGNHLLGEPWRGAPLGRRRGMQVGHDARRPKGGVRLAAARLPDVEHRAAAAREQPRQQLPRAVLIGLHEDVGGEV